MGLTIFISTIDFISVFSVFNLNLFLFFLCVYLSPNIDFRND